MYIEYFFQIVTLIIVIIAIYFLLKFNRLLNLAIKYLMKKLEE